MASDTKLATVGFSGKDITSRVALGSHSPSRSTFVVVEPVLGTVASGAASITLYVEKNGVEYDYFTDTKQAASDTAKAWGSPFVVPADANDGIEVFALSTNGSDTSVAGQIVFHDGMASNIDRVDGATVTIDSFKATTVTVTGSVSIGTGVVNANVVELAGTGIVTQNGRVYAFNQDGQNIVAAAGAASLTPSPAGDSFMTLEEARTLVRDSGLQATEADYSNARVDRAIQAIGDDITRRAKLVRAEGTVALNSTARTFNVTSSLSDFTPARLLRSELVRYDDDADDFGTEVAHVDYRELAKNAHSGTTNATRTPTRLAFRTNGGEGFLDCNPGTAYPRLRLSYYQPFTTFVPGTSGASSIVLNVPEGILRGALIFGGPVMLQHVDPIQRFENSAWQKYNQIIDEARGNVGVDSGPLLLGDDDAYI